MSRVNHAQIHHPHISHPTPDPLPPWIKKVGGTVFGVLSIASTAVLLLVTYVYAEGLSSARVRSILQTLPLPIAIVHGHPVTLPEIEAYAHEQHFLLDQSPYVSDKLKESFVLDILRKNDVINPIRDAIPPEQATVYLQQKVEEAKVVWLMP